MRFVTHRSIFCFALVVLLTLVTLDTAVTASAACTPPSCSSTNASVAVNAGSLSESAPATAVATAVTLSGDDQTTSYSLGLTVTDATGSGTGWNMTITSTTFSTGGGAHSLSTTASTINAAPNVTCNSGSSCTNPDNSSTHYPVTVPAAATAPQAVKFFDAAANSGMGKFTIAPTVTIAIPANTIAGSYTSTISVAMVSGP
jgi:hypothetical protein